MKEEQVKETLDFRLGFIDFCSCALYLSLHGSGYLETCLNQYVKRMTAPPVVWGPLC